jgi:hypothetical protein
MLGSPEAPPSPLQGAGVEEEIAPVVDWPNAGDSPSKMINVLATDRNLGMLVPFTLDPILWVIG